MAIKLNFIKVSEKLLENANLVLDERISLNKYEDLQTPEGWHVQVARDHIVMAIKHLQDALKE